MATNRDEVVGTDTVGTLTHRPVVEVHGEDTLRRVALTLTEESIGAAVVMGTRPANRKGVHARGLISERDIVRALAEGADPDDTCAEDVMTSDIAFAQPAEQLSDVVRRLLDNEIRHLPILADDGVVVGMVSARDVLEALARSSAPLDA